MDMEVFIEGVSDISVAKDIRTAPESLQRHLPLR